MVINFNIIFSNEVPKYQTQKYLKKQMEGNHVFWKLYNYKQSVCPLEGAQRAEPLNGYVGIRLGKETQIYGSGIDTSRGNIRSVPGICIPPLHIIILYIPGECVHSG